MMVFLLRYNFLLRIDPDLRQDDIRAEYYRASSSVTGPLYFRAF